MFEAYFSTTMRRNRTSAWESFYPMQRFCRCLALWCVEKERNTLYTKANKRIRNTMLCLVVIGWITKLWLPHTLKTWDTVQNSILVAHLMYVCIVALPAIGFYSCLVSHILAKNMINAFRAIDNVDRLFNKMGCSRKLIQLNYYSRYFCKVAVIGIIVPKSLGLFIRCWYGWKLRNTPWILQTAAACVFYSLHLSIVTQFIVWCVILRKRFELINYLFKTMARETALYRRSPHDDDHFIATIRKVIHLQQSLVSITREISSAYSLSLLFQISLYLILLMCECYVLAYLLIFNTQLDLIYIIGNIHHICEPCWELFAIVYFTAHLCNEVSQRVIDVRLFMYVLNNE